MDTTPCTSVLYFGLPRGALSWGFTADAAAAAVRDSCHNRWSPGFGSRGRRCRTILRAVEKRGFRGGLMTARNRSGHAAGEDVLFDDRVDAPVAVNHLGDPEVDADR